MASGLSGKRLTFLRALVHAAEYRTDVGLDARAVAAQIGLSEDEADRIENWLTTHQYVEGMTIEWIRITSLAVDAIEEYEDEQDAAAPVVEGKTTMSLDPKKVFIIYGRNQKAFEAMRTFLRSLGLSPSDFNEMVEKAGGSPYIGQVIKDNMATSQAVVAIFTPDEHATLRSEYQGAHDRPADRERWQARPNVILEAGMALGIDEDRTILVTLGKLDLSSDLDGRHVVRMHNATGPRDHLKKRLKTAGCDLTGEQSDWHTAGDFDAAVNGLSYDAPERRLASAGEAAPNPTTMTRDTTVMKLIVWLKNAPDEVHEGTPIEVARIEREAGIPAGAGSLIKDPEVLGKRWRVVNFKGGYVQLERQSDNVAIVDVVRSDRYGRRIP